MNPEHQLCATHLALDLLERGTGVDRVATLTGLPILRVGELARRTRTNPAHYTARARLRADLNHITTGEPT